MGDPEDALGGVEGESLRRFLAPLQALGRVLEHFENRGIIIGGLAVGLLTEPRFTDDVDAMLILSLERADEFLEVAAKENLVSRIAGPLVFARRAHVFLLQHIPSGIRVDVSLGMLPVEIEAVDRSNLVQLGELTLRLPTAEDLIIFKAVAHRPKDLIDIRAVIEHYPNLDVKRIRTWVNDLGALLERPELWTDIAGWLEPQPAPRPRRRRS